MFEEIGDAALIDTMGDATRAESVAIAQRLAAVGELDARRARRDARCPSTALTASHSRT